ncbi:MAG TPA: hypothetical protein VEJ44_05445, partial [Acidimicrobiales bacterium]|nr:hypothetical protein [Acidimicrobiales bacterium]
MADAAPEPSVPDIEGLLSDGTAAVRAASSTERVRDLAAELVGRHSALVRARAGLGSLDPATRRDLGQRINHALGELQALIDERTEELASEEEARAIERDRIDLTELVPSAVRVPPWRGHSHLVAQTQSVLEDVFVGMGFEVAEGPEVETDWYNFGALNIPPAHPARSMWDSFYLDVGEPETVLLRTHTS